LEVEAGERRTAFKTSPGGGCESRGENFHSCLVERWQVVNKLSHTSRRSGLGQYKKIMIHVWLVVANRAMSRIRDSAAVAGVKSAESRIRLDASAQGRII